eukprot:2279693-Pyramimonas_sp.AAC.1
MIREDGEHMMIIERLSNKTARQVEHSRWVGLTIYPRSLCSRTVSAQEVQRSRSQFESAFQADVEMRPSGPDTSGVQPCRGPDHVQELRGAPVQVPLREDERPDAPPVCSLPAVYPPPGDHGCGPARGAHDEPVELLGQRGHGDDNGAD